MIFERLRRAAAGFLILTAMGCPSKREPPPAKRAAAVQGPVGQDRRFSGSVRLAVPGGSEAVRVEIVNLGLANQHKLERLPLPFEGTLMVSLQAGDVTTSIAGQREERRQGQIWTVPPGVGMGLETGRDAASLQTILIGK
jgi:hypothetical protein